MAQTFLFCEASLGGRVFTMERQTSWSPPKRGPWEEKCLDGTDCIMQNYQEPTWKFSERKMFSVDILFHLISQTNRWARKKITKWFGFFPNWRTLHFKNQCKIDMDKNQSHGRVYRAFEEYTESPCICICWLCICICRLCICIGSIWRSTLRALITLVSFLPPPSSLSIQAIAEWQRQSPFICHGQEPAFSFVMHFNTFSTGIATGTF